MDAQQLTLFGLLLAIFALLIWGRFRYDLVAFGALVVASAIGAVPKDDIFSGFGHPATVIIGLVLIVSRGLSNSGAIELLARLVISSSRGIRAHIGIMSSVSASLSAVMNNVAALALLMPVDMKAAAKAGRSPALTLMPLSFASILGGMVTLIGTPPNVVIATFREQALGEPYRMFDFAPVGALTAVVGVLFVALIGWRLIPADRRKRDSSQDLMDLTGYVAEAEFTEASPAIGQLLKEVEPFAEEHDVSIVGLIRGGKRLPGLAREEEVRKSDLVVLEGAPNAIEQFVGAAKLKFIGAEKHGGLRSKSVTLAEVVVPQGSRIEGRSALDIRLLYRHGVTLLGVSRHGRPFRERVRKLKVRSGDVLLLFGPAEPMPDVISWMGCLPLAERGLQVTQRRKAGLAVGVFAAAIILASLGVLYLPVALAAVAVAYILLNIVPLSQIYHSIEWPVIVLLGSLIPIGGALEASGGTALLARQLVEWTAGLPPAFVLIALMAVTMTLSDVLNNVATALIAAPIAVDVALRLDVSPDPFLMGVAVAASCAFLTPIGHKNNTIIMGPGGYRFGDYWKMGLPLELLVLAISAPLILWFWPL